jgi:hypothetical protein
MGPLPPPLTHQSAATKPIFSVSHRVEHTLSLFSVSNS